MRFGYDVLDVMRLGLLDDLDDALDDIESGYDFNFGFDVVDWINEGREHELATLCPACGKEWLMGSEALDAGLCWRCRT
jgi:hypothetical protein